MLSRHSIEARRQWQKHWGDEPVPSMSAVTSIMRAQQILLARLNETLKPFDLTFPRYEALMLLYYSRRGALPLGKMGDRLQLRHQLLSCYRSTSASVDARLGRLDGTATADSRDARSRRFMGTRR